ncbi:GMC oxidoreductase [Dactylosporangium sp. NPDC051541]|uniref:GMC oxidoreductase n=1 Tax=Dactylosporangium sp. NPDC051541 TaxID=3363977 RepID=UPI00378D4A28
MPGAQARIGGRSKAWYGVTLRLSEQVRADWPAPIAARLPRLYERTERRLADWKGAALDEPTCPADVALAGLPSLTGQPFRIVPTAAFWHAGPSGPVWRAFSPIDEIDHPEVTIIEGRRVVEVEAARGDGLEVVSLDEVTGEPLRTTAHTVVLAAGTLETTRIFAQSMDRLGGVRAPAWPGLASKIKQGVLTRPAPWMLERYRSGDLAYLVAEHPQDNANLFLELRDDATGRPYVDLWWFAEQSATERATVTFTAEGAIWAGTVACEFGAVDRQLAAERAQLANRLLAEWGCQPADLGRDPHPGKASAQAVFDREAVHYRNPIGLSDHESGTIPLGEHLDDTGMSRTVEGLYVAGPAAFPRAGAANPSLTILALARLLAETISAPASRRAPHTPALSSFRSADERHQGSTHR